MAVQNPVNLIVLVDEAHRDNLAGIAGDLESRGFVLKEALAAIGILTGSAPAAALPGLSDVPGVTSVEEERTDYRPLG